MPRIERVDIGNYVYHVINRANTRVQIFDGDNIWIGKMVDKFKLGQTLRGIGRPKNGG
ncbi:MAG: hypothetical protein NUV64_03150 [Parcubacteria group bacterium]|nr:hypothetical protein [Parcubacteria group bacterium]MCR4342405.1 hypothetical protein [Patescibacteria group bacterium]